MITIVPSKLYPYPTKKEAPKIFLYFGSNTSKDDNASC